MGREIPGSSFERGDGERRTWDEMVWWEQPFESPDDDVFDAGDYVVHEGDDPITLEDWLAGMAAPTSLATERWLLRDIDDRVAELEERIYYRNMAVTAGEAVDATAAASDEAEYAELVEFRKQHPDPEADTDAAPAAARPSASARELSTPARSAAPTSPVRMVETAIKERLTPSEFLHWQELLKGTQQDVIAYKLGIKQSAVSKRERRLRERVDAISVATVGRPYPERLVDRGLWARQGRRRNKSALRQR